MNGYGITDVAIPQLPYDASNKKYVDDAIAASSTGTLTLGAATNNAALE